MSIQGNGIDSSLRMLFDQMPGLWGCKDLELKFIYANAEYAKAIGLKDHLDIVGRTDYDMPSNTVNCADAFRSQDQMVIDQKQKMKVLDIHPFEDGSWKIFLFSKTPYLDVTNEVSGIIFHGEEITNSSLLEIGSMLSKIPFKKPVINGLGQNSYQVDSMSNPINLSPRQSEVLFFLIRGKTGAQVAKILGISIRTFQEHLDHIKNKFNAQNKYELIDKAVELGYLNIIPASLFTTQLSVALKDQ
ncbi:MAG: PAS domain-containing protein [Oligoflexales bacterium]